MSKFLTPQQKVDRFVQLKSQIKSAITELDILTEELLPLLRKGKCPSGGPFILELQICKKPNHKWKEYAKALAVEMYGRSLAAIKIRKAIKAAGTTVIEKVLPKINPQWGGK